jgi:hypothetical protein
MLTPLTALLLVALPVVAGAQEMWRWEDRTGRVHYSNVPDHVPSHAEAIHAHIGVVGADVPPPAVSRSEVSDLLDPDVLARRRAGRRLRRRLREIETFYDQVRARQRARLEEHWPNSTILPDWVVADQWLQVKEEEAQLRDELARLHP